MVSFRSVIGTIYYMHKQLFIMKTVIIVDVYPPSNMSPP